MRKSFVDWPQIPLGNVLEERTEIPNPNDLELGLTPIVSKIGFDTGKIELRQVGKTRTKMILIRPGDLVLSGINAAKGAIAICEEKIPISATIHYSSYKPNHERIDILFLWYFFRSEAFREILKDNIPGGIKTELKPKRFLPIKVPLPPLPEQQRIVARIKQLTSRIEEAKVLRQEAVEQAEVLSHIAFEKILSEVNEYGWDVKPLNKACKINPSRRGKTDHPDDLSVTFVPMSAVDEKKGVISSSQVVPFGQVKKGYTWFIEDDVVFARITPCMQNGKAAIAINLANMVGFGSTEFHVLRPKGDVLPEWVHRFIRRPKFRKSAEESFKGTAGQQRVPQSFFETQHIPVPPLEDQRRIVDYLDKLQPQIDELRKYQTETQKQIDALSQSILAKAFRGELEVNKMIHTCQRVGTKENEN
ncbi:restriction endonuclease subunit S [bacterium]|nr:restriction endonuclease subunit S [bacterium]